MAAAQISVPPDVLETWKDFKTKRLYKWMLLRLDLDRFELCVDRTGAPSSTMEDFIKALPDSEPRYAVFDQVKQNTYGGINTRLYCFLWSPSNAGKMNLGYAASRKSLDSFFAGVEAKQCTTKKGVEEVLQTAGSSGGVAGGVAAAGKGAGAISKKKKVDDDDDAFDPDA
jgi:cofilin